MVILMFASIFPPAIGGPATQSASLCRALHARGQRVVVLTPGGQFEKRNTDGFTVYRYPWKYTNTVLDRGIRWAVFPFYFLYVVIKERPQILHAHAVSAPSFIAGAIAKILGIPSVIKFAGDWVWETLSTPKVQGKDFEEVYTSSSLGRLLRRIERFGVSLYTLIWVPSDFRRENVRALMGTDKQVVQIPNSLLLPPGGMQEWHKNTPAVVISANRFIPHKRVSMIVRAFAKGAPKNATLVLIGTGEEREIDIVKKEIDTCHVKDRVILTGKLPSIEVYAHFKKATLYVSASLEEGFPNVFIEAMHYGLPIVSTDAGGSRELVSEDKTGFLVNVMDEYALTERISRILGDEDLRNRLAGTAVEHAKRYDLHYVIDDFIRMYKRLLSRHV